MTIYISGGSNSLIKDGWVAKFRERLPEELEVENISIGAAPSHMGTFRCLHTIDLKPGDVVLWEYGVNDANHIDARGYTNRELRKALEWTIRHCHDRQVKFGAIIFQPRDREMQQQMTPYRKMLHRICDRYGVDYFDVPLAFLEQHPNKKRIPPRYFRDNAHYHTLDDLMDLIADGAVKVLENARVPGEALENDTGELRIYSSFEGGELEEFSSKAITLQTWRPGPDGLTTTFEGDGRIVGLVITSTPMGGVFDLRVGDQQMRLCATYQEREFNKTLVKYVSIPMLLGEDIVFEAGMPITISWADTAEDMYSDYRFRNKVGEAAIAAREAGVVAVMTEE